MGDNVAVTTAKAPRRGTYSDFEREAQVGQQHAAQISVQVAITSKVGAGGFGKPPQRMRDLLHCSLQSIALPGQSLCQRAFTLSLAHGCSSISESTHDTAKTKNWPDITVNVRTAQVKKKPPASRWQKRLREPL
jgi:hypothetical protein